MLVQNPDKLAKMLGQGWSHVWTRVATPYTQAKTLSAVLCVLLSHVLWLHCKFKSRMYIMLINFFADQL